MEDFLSPGIPGSWHKTAPCTGNIQDTTSHGRKEVVSFLEQKGREILEKAVFRKEGERPQNQQTSSQVKKERRCGAKLGHMDKWKGGARDPPKGQVVPAQGCTSPVDGHWSGCISSASQGVKVPRRGDTGHN